MQGAFTSLYVGGGTPSLCIDQLAPILARLPVTGERAMELLPAHVTADRAARLLDLGFTFASVGVQSFDAEVLAHLGRPGDEASHRRAVAVARDHFEIVDVDLIFDVAFQAPQVFLRDLEICLELGVDQVSTYPLMRFGYTPFGKARHTPRQEHQLLRRAEELAAAHGYERRTVWTFNRRDAPSYTSITRDLYVGLGASAASFLGSHFTVNHFSPEHYAAALAAGHLPQARSWRLHRPVAALYWLFWQAYAGRVSQAELDRLFARPPPVGAVLWALEAVGLLRPEGDLLVLTAAGRDAYHDLERWVTYHYIEPLWADLNREHEPQDQPPGLAAPPGLTGRLQRRLPWLPARGGQG